MVYLTVKLFIKAVQSKLIDAGIGIAGVILNGSAASHVISDGESYYWLINNESLNIILYVFFQITLKITKIWT